MAEVLKERTYGYSRKTGEARLFEVGETMPSEFTTKLPPGVHNHDKERGVKFEPEAEKPEAETGQEAGQMNRNFQKGGR